MHKGSKLGIMAELVCLHACRQLHAVRSDLLELKPQCQACMSYCYTAA